MKRISKLAAIAAAGLVALVQSVQAQTLVNTWSYAGGGLNSASYGGNYQPTTLIPDVANSNGASIVVGGMTTGGLGSAGIGNYGGIYTFFSANPSFSLLTTTMLDGVDEITISFLAGDGDPAMAYDATSLTLNYNASNSSVASSEFSAVGGIVISSPIGPQELTRYTWTWTDVSSLGASSALSTSWDTQNSQHVFYDEITFTQAVPEPSTFGLIVLAGSALALRRKRRPSPVS